MADLLSQDVVDQFRAAMRSVTDTFHKSPVTLRAAAGVETPLLAGVKPDDAGSYGEIHGEKYVQDEQTEFTERWIVSFNRDYLAEKGLVANDQVLIDPDRDWILIKEKRYAIVGISDKAIFRGLPTLVKLTVQR